MDKKKMVFTVGTMEFDEQKNTFTGYVNGDYCQMKQASNGKWYINASRDVTFFEPRQSNQSTQQEEDSFR